LTAEDKRVAYMATVAVLDRAGVKPIDFDPNAETAAIGTSYSMSKRLAIFRSRKSGSRKQQGRAFMATSVQLVTCCRMCTG
jgi:hypothetical protein